MKRLFTAIMIIGVWSVPFTVSAQPAYVEFSYQTFRPFIHFQLNIGNSYQHYEDPYDRAYLKGYMDGVNDIYYNDYRFYDMVYDIDLYEAGFRDGYRDRDLMIRMRGLNGYYRYRFTYEDYHSPYYSVQVWLGGLSLAFLQVSEHRLPRRWKSRANHRFIEYRHWHKHRHRYNNRDYRHYVHVERDYKKRLNRYRKEADRVRHRYQKNSKRNGYRSGKIERYSKVNKREVRQRIRKQPEARTNRTGMLYNTRRSQSHENMEARRSSNRNIEIRSNSRIDKDRKSNNRDNKKLKRSKNDQKKAFRSGNRRGEDSKRTIRRENTREKSRGSIQRNKNDKKSKSRKSRKNNK